MKKHALLLVRLVELDKYCKKSLDHRNKGKSPVSREGTKNYLRIISQRSKDFSISFAILLFFFYFYLFLLFLFYFIIITFILFIILFYYYYFYFIYYFILFSILFLRLRLFYPENQYNQ